LWGFPRRWRLLRVVAAPLVRGAAGPLDGFAVAAGGGCCFLWPAGRLRPPSGDSTLRCWVIAVVGGSSEVVVHPCQCSFVASPPCYAYACGQIKRMLCRYRHLGGSLAAVVASWADAWPPITVLFGFRRMLCRLGGCFATSSSWWNLCRCRRFSGGCLAAVFCAFRS
jgi:hypothetical protein